MTINPVSVYTKTVRYKKDYIEVDLKIPIFHGPLFSNALDKVNRSIESDIMEFRRQMEEAAQEYVEVPLREGREVEPYVISDVYRVTFNRNNLLSIVIIYNEYIEGKNYFIKVSYNFDIRTGNPLSLQDLFKRGVDYKKLLDDAIQRKLQEDEDAYFPGAAEQFEGIRVGQPFYLEGDSIVVFFGFHQIAPTEAGIPVIRLPFQMFRGALKAELVM